MTRSVARWAGWMGACALAIVVAACGGGGGGTDVAVAGAPVGAVDAGGGVGVGGGTDAGGGNGLDPAPLADARSGSYRLAGADGQEYLLAIDFDLHTYALSGATFSEGGSFTQDAGDFLFQPRNRAASAFDVRRFRFATDAVVGEYELPQGTLPFVAVRRFASTFQQAAGVYNVLGRRLDATTGAVLRTTIQQFELTPDGRLLTCRDERVFQLSDCFPQQRITANLEIQGDLFRATTPEASFPFRVGLVGNERILTFDDSFPDGTRRFALGFPATGTFAPGTFLGGTSQPAWGTVTVGATAFARADTSAQGAAGRGGGRVDPADTADLRVIDASDLSTLFAVRNAEIGFLLAGPENTVAPAFLSIGVAQ